MCPPHLRGTSTSPTANSLSHRIVKKDLAFGFFGHYIVIADINRFSAIAEQHAGGLWLNYAHGVFERAETRFGRVVN